MTIVGLSNLVLDYYFYNNKIYLNGGGTVSNILANLSSMGIDTKICGYYGNDYGGRVAKKLIEECHVDTSLLTRKNYLTKKFFITPSGFSSTCPYCHKKTKNIPLNLDIQNIISQNDIILIQDYVKLPNIPNKICLDFGYYQKLIYEDNKVLENFIFRKYYLVSIKESVLTFILNKLHLTFETFINKIDIYLLLITKGRKGTTIIYQKKEYNYQVEPFEEVETNGCGDIFFATFISETLKRQKLIPSDLDDIFNIASANVHTVINNIGARHHLIPNKIIIKNQKCICENFKITN